MQQNNKNPHFVSRGYGGTLHNVIVDMQQHTPQQVGDEPLLLARQVPTVVSPDRYLGAQIAENAGADIIIMDDGFQNPKLHKDLSFWSLTADSDMAMAGVFRQDLCAKAYQQG